MLVIDSTQLTNVPFNLSDQALNVLQVPSRLTEDPRGHPEQRDEEQTKQTSPPPLPIAS